MTWKRLCVTYELIAENASSYEQSFLIRGLLDSNNIEVSGGNKFGYRFSEEALGKSESDHEI